MAWATISEVAEITGATVEADLLAQADGIITVYCGRTPDMQDKLRKRDQYWLRAATAWQAVWMTGQAGVTARNLGTTIETEGLTVEHAAEYEVVLAPLAARSLRNLSWKSSRAVAVGTTSHSIGARNFTLEQSDPCSVWYPL
jgi:hypothetical protein